jgi:uncharacterized iron-regulated membrane protein
MPTARTCLFWLHLTAGSLAGVVILIMSVTGVALTYEKQLVEWADRRAWSAPPSADAKALSPETLLARVRDARPEAAPATLTLRADPAAPATLALEGNRALLVNPYTGDIIGPPPTGLRSFFRTMTSWHRYIALEGASRATGKAVTGAANLLFLFIVLSGMYLWIPRVWKWLAFKQVLWFRRGLPGKARDFNWHNVIGIWSAVPLAIVVAGAVPISYAWASNLVYRMVGEEPPRPAGPPPGPSAAGPRVQGLGGPGGPAAGRRAEGLSPSDGPGERDARRDNSVAGLDAAYSQALAAVPGWRTMALRLPQASQSSIAVTVDEGFGGQPQFRHTLTIALASGVLEKQETFGDQSRGRRLRSWLRFAHTGEYYGLAGQTIAGIVSAGGVVLVYTGIALALRRLTSWIRRRSAAGSADRARAA